ncbi:MAG: hypothetical protein HKM95_07970 [Inquilinus sp.]|nr:hypothetical protein [Inquilinus sp.]
MEFGVVEPDPEAGCCDLCGGNGSHQLLGLFHGLLGELWKNPGGEYCINPDPFPGPDCPFDYPRIAVDFILVYAGVCFFVVLLPSAAIILCMVGYNAIMRRWTANSSA